jgi:acyl carrier protein
MMRRMEEAQARNKLRDWILKHAKTPPGAAFSDQTPLLEGGILSSLDIVEFVLFIESLRGEDVDVDDIDPRVFTSIDTLHAAFFAPA